MAEEEPLFKVDDRAYLPVKVVRVIPRDEQACYIVQGNFGHVTVTEDGLSSISDKVWINPVTGQVFSSPQAAVAYSRKEADRESSYNQQQFWTALSLDGKTAVVMGRCRATDHWQLLFQLQRRDIIGA